VLGKTFTKQGIGAVSGLPAEEVDALLAALLRKEVLSIQADPRSPERGQYSFLLDIVKHVAYETLSKRERKEKHLAAARYLATLWGGAEEDEIVEVVAAHYLDAWRAAPDADDAEEIKGTARDMLTRAAERASSLGANAEAQRAYERALELTPDERDRADLHEHAGIEATAGARAEEALRHYEGALARAEHEGGHARVAGVGAARPSSSSATRGNRRWERGLVGQAYAAFALGRWDEVLEHIPELLAEELETSRLPLSAMLYAAVGAHVHRGELEEADRIVEHLAELYTSADAQERASWAAARSCVLLASGEPGEAWRVAEDGLELREALGVSPST
jgi:tetratricopeptide (TPR) repeat protein